MAGARISHRMRRRSGRRDRIHGTQGPDGPLFGPRRRPARDEGEVRAAYKQAALRFHPDKCASKRGLWHALLGGAARCARRFHAASAAEEVLSDDAKRIDYDVELARIEFERNARRQRHAYGGGGLLPDWFRPGARRVLPLRGLPLPRNLDVRGGARPARRQARRRAETDRRGSERGAHGRGPAPAGGPERGAAAAGSGAAAPSSGRTASSARRRAASTAPPAGTGVRAHAGPPAAAPAAARGAAPARRGRGTRVGGGRGAAGPERDGRRLRAVARGRPTEGRTARRRRRRDRGSARTSDSRSPRGRQAASGSDARGDRADGQARARETTGRTTAGANLLVSRPNLAGPIVSWTPLDGRPTNFALVHLGPPMRTLDDDDAPLSSLGPGPVALMVTDLDAAWPD